MARFFISPSQISGDMLSICGEEANHMLRVLRMRAGDTFTACDGARGDYECVITEIDKKEVRARILEKKENAAEPKMKLTLYQGIPKGAKLDYIVQKCVEIGVCRIVPMQTERVVRGGDVRRDRLLRIALEAAKQSGRGVVPTVEEAMPFAAAVAEAKKADIALFPYECEKEKSLKSVLREKRPTSVSILIGPEGGFSEAEAALAEAEGLLVVSLGKRILRTETAGLITCGNILYEAEE